ncbi:MAG: hypothetical protein ACI8Z9_002362 [Paraglaciecola sp.]|jgi:hypothetical protein
MPDALHWAFLYIRVFPEAAPLLAALPHLYRQAEARRLSKLMGLELSHIGW